MTIDPFSSIWEEILSREPTRIRKAFDPLSTKEKEAIAEHLRKMSTEDDWHPAQIRSALIALKAISLKGKDHHD